MMRVRPASGDCVRCLLSLVLLNGLMSGSGTVFGQETASSAAETPASTVDYATQVKPLLAERCFHCHGALKQESSLRLDSGASILQGGDAGESVVPGQSADSLLIDMIRSEDGEHPAMPPEGEAVAFTTEQVELIARWIDQGASFPEDDAPEADPRAYWSYQAVERPELPTGFADGNPVDAFINARLAEKNLPAVSRADAHTLLRRVYLDLVGLPPDADTIAAYVADPSPEAYAEIVDRLLASPQYGERWGRHWMDVWRYSDWYGSTAAKEIRNSQYHIWHWRDWIVESLNADKGYDRMLHEMLAADELVPEDRDALRATGYLGRSWYLFNRTTWLIDTVEHANMAFLGVTMKCARCHDHKYDPIAQQDYYQFRAFFEPHDVRTDPYPDEADVLKKGLPRVYDKMVDAPTYLFERGDERAPRKDEPLAPNVAGVFGVPLEEVQPVSLPVEARYHQLKPDFLKVAEQEITNRIKTAQQELQALRTQQQEVVAAAGKVEGTDQTASRDDLSRDVDSRPWLSFDPGQELKQQWDVIDGKWNVDGLLLKPEESGGWPYLASQQTMPQDFYAHLVYRTAPGGNYRSIGFSFDFQKHGESQDVYTSTGDKEQSVQAFHRIGGKEHYPASGVVKTAIKLGEPTTLEVVVRGRDMRIWLNGELKLDYVIPRRRRDGKFALWVYSGTAEFSQVEVRALNGTPADHQRRTRELQLAADLKSLQVESLQAEKAALNKRAAAERAKYDGTEETVAQQLAVAADQAEKQVQHILKQGELLESEHYLQLVRQFEEEVPERQEGIENLLASAQRFQTTSTTMLADSQAAMAAAEGKYKPLGEPYPAQSTGRRLALARWMTNREHPRTARIAANHIWLRHFGKAIVPTVADFGVRSADRTHPQLLDWLAAELMDNQWSMKHLHRLIVTSAVYQRATVAPADHPGRTADKDNSLYWRMNSRRLEAEAIRDSILQASGSLDLAQGGPTLPQTDGHTTHRRSLYYQTTPDNRMDFLAQFDAPNPVQCYERKISVVPQQALALNNSVLAQNHARKLAAQLQELDETEFIQTCFMTLLCRPPTDKEQQMSQTFLAGHQQLLQDSENLTPLLPGDEGVTPPSTDPVQRARENLVGVIMNHNDFVTVR